MNLNTAKDCQQLVSGFRTVAVIGGPCMVRVHEALDSIFQGQPSRYFISVDLKFRESDALNIGAMGWLGCTKAEATREANDLARRIIVAHTALEAAKAAVAESNTSTNQHTQKRNQAAFDKIVGRYCAEFAQ